MNDPERAEQSEVWAEALGLVNEKAWSRPAADGEEGGSKPECATCDGRHWLCDECKLPPTRCIHGGHLSWSGCPDCRHHPDHPVNNSQPPDVEEGGREPGVDEWCCDSCGKIAPEETEGWEQTPQDDAGVSVERCPACNGSGKRSREPGVDDA